MIYVIHSAWGYDSGGDVFGVYDDKETALKVAKSMQSHHDYMEVSECQLNAALPKKDQYGDYISLEPIWRDK